MEQVKKKIGELLIDAGVVTEEIIQDALRNKAVGQRIGDYLVGTGSVSEDILYEKLGEQLKIPVYKLGDIEIPMELLEDGDLPRDVLRRGLAFATDLVGSLVTVALSDPLDEATMEEIREAMPYDVNFVIAKKSEITDYIGKYYDQDDSISLLFSDIVGSDKSDLVVADTLTGLVREQGRFSIVIRDLSGSLDVLKGSFGKSDRELRDFLAFAIKSVGLKKDSSNGSYDVILPLDDSSKLFMQIVYSVVGLRKEYWIDCTLVEPDTVSGSGLFSSIDRPGLYVVLNPRFSKRRVYQDGVIGMNRNGKFTDRVVVVSDDVMYESSGLLTLKSGSGNLHNYHNFGDVFVFDKGWELDYVTDMFNLLSEEKVLLIHLPFENETDMDEFLNGSFEGSSLRKLISAVVSC